MKLKITNAEASTLRRAQKEQSLGLVRYADDFVIIHHDRRVARACLKEVKKFLMPFRTKELRNFFGENQYYSYVKVG